MDNNNLSIAEVQRKITNCLREQVVGSCVLEALVFNGEFVPKEGVLWDYKEKADLDQLGLAKVVRHIVSFYNTYGGYIIYGVSEEIPDIKFVGSGVDENSLDIQKLRANIEKYTGDTIDVTYREIPYQIGSKELVYGILNVPKRHHDIHPVMFVKNGPQKNPRSLLFNVDDIYYRKGDKCIPAKEPEEFIFLARDRDRAKLFDFSEESVRAIASTVTLSHNLPNKNLICSKLIGRRKILSDLWKWLSDEFQYAKVLAGDGGKGKTSIAYEFATQIAKSSPYNFEQVIWLTAKKRQFSGIYNEFYDLPETHYQDLETLLKEIGIMVGLGQDELETNSIAILKKRVKAAIQTLPAMIVVDDLDSTDPNEQKRIMETVQWMGDQNSRFLLTTRANLSYSTDMSLVVPGMERDEYNDYIAELNRKFSVNIVKKNVIDKLFKATSGSPLLTESIVRLVRKGSPLEQAVIQWSGQAGEDVRNVALRKEIDGLSDQARRVLLSASLLGQCSLSELKQLTGIEDTQLQDCIAELQSLFLISAPRIIEEEPRFEVPPNTIAVVEQNKTRLASDHASLQGKVKKLRSGVRFEKKIGNRRMVGQAISQAHALAREGDYGNAIKTLDNTLRKQKNQPDLLLAKGKLLFNAENSNLDSARKLFRRSFENGQRKELLFELWYDAEIEAKYQHGAVEVSTYALENKIGDELSWLRKRAVAEASQGIIFDKSGELGSALSNYELACEDMKKAVNISSGIEKYELIQEAAALHDLCWNKAKALDKQRWSTAFNIAHKAVQRGDLRSVNFYRMTEAIEQLESEFSSSDVRLSSVESLVNTSINKLHGSLNKQINVRFSEKIVSEKMVEEVKQRLTDVAERMSVDLSFT